MAEVWKKNSNDHQSLSLSKIDSNFFFSFGHIQYQKQTKNFEIILNLL